VIIKRIFKYLGDLTIPNWYKVIIFRIGSFISCVDLVNKNILIEEEKRC